MHQVLNGVNIPLLHFKVLIIVALFPLFLSLSSKKTSVMQAMKYHKYCTGRITTVAQGYLFQILSDGSHIWHTYDTSKLNCISWQQSSFHSTEISGKQSLVFCFAGPRSWVCCFSCFMYCLRFLVKNRWIIFTWPALMSWLQHVLPQNCHGKRWR